MKDDAKRFKEQKVENQKDEKTSVKRLSKRRKVKNHRHLKKDESSMLQSLEQRITLINSAKDTTETHILNGGHVRFANQSQKKYWTYQNLEVQAQQKQESQMTL